MKRKISHWALCNPSGVQGHTSSNPSDILAMRNSDPKENPVDLNATRNHWAYGCDDGVQQVVCRVEAVGVRKKKSRRLDLARGNFFFNGAVLLDSVRNPLFVVSSSLNGTCENCRFSGSANVFEVTTFEFFSA